MKLSDLFVLRRHKRLSHANECSLPQLLIGKQALIPFHKSYINII